jgi:hypothetical protein
MAVGALANILRIDCCHQLLSALPKALTELLDYCTVPQRLRGLAAPTTKDQRMQHHWLGPAGAATLPWGAVVVATA